MKRIPEPELMTEKEQVEAYGNADFEEPHSYFMSLLKKYIPDAGNIVNVLDLGSGAGDIVLRFAKNYPNAIIHCVEGSAEMIGYADNMLREYPELRDRVVFINSLLQDFSPVRDYGLVMSNSLLHHLHEPEVFWDKIKEASVPGTTVFIMDLMRPESIDQAESLTDKYTQGEPEILRRDFYNSLLAAYEIDEINDQLSKSALENLIARKVSDRHLIIYGECK